MKLFVDGYFRFEPKDLEIMRFVHEQYLGAFQHFKMICEAKTRREIRVCHHRIRQLLDHGHLEMGYWEEQRIHYFTLAWKGLNRLRRRDGYLDQLMNLYRMPGPSSARIGERLKAGLIRLVLYGRGLKDWTSERVLKERDQRIYPVPTGELLFRDEKIAVHLEEAAKRPLRSYETLFTDYAKWGYKKVWMIVGWEMEDYLRRIKEEFRSSWPEVWFTPYQAFSAKDGESIFHNHEGQKSCLKDFLAPGKEAPKKC